MVASLKVQPWPGGSAWVVGRGRATPGPGGPKFLVLEEASSRDNVDVVTGDLQASTGHCSATQAGSGQAQASSCCGRHEPRGPLW